MGVGCTSPLLANGACWLRGRAPSSKQPPPQIISLPGAHYTVLTAHVSWGRGVPPGAGQRPSPSVLAEASLNWQGRRQVGDSSKHCCLCGCGCLVSTTAPENRHAAALPSSSHLARQYDTSQETRWSGGSGMSQALHREGECLLHHSSSMLVVGTTQGSAFQMSLQQHRRQSSNITNP